jgi:hypothetical protein
MSMHTAATVSSMQRTKLPLCMVTFQVHELAYLIIPIKEFLAGLQHSKMRWYTCVGGRIEDRHNSN